MIAETFGHLGEALIALQLIKKYGLPAVITLAIHQTDVTRDGYLVEHAMHLLEKAGADVVGLNCYRGPETMLPLLETIVKAVKIPVAALPVPYRTTEKEPTFMALTNDKLPACTINHRPFPVALDSKYYTRYEITEFAKRAIKIGVRYIGLCCGAGPHHLRNLAEAIGRKPPGSKYSPDMSLHCVWFR